ncbi:M16 family metallopeptidase [Alistipes dispar]|uniref:M16 family metallopeptidase n=1 Tax=Alistipes TaxID=239759 RepID=UPI001B388390|nr:MULTISPECIES: M16 family metallopeptidase [Alistipes]MBQ4903068.1 insulinase family protein [Alistipes sp. Marseille-P2263]MBS5642748.1 insulinase family protein [Alistipes sp.]MCI2258824.1 insulinase family protein [Alistipes dispar]
MLAAAVFAAGSAMAQFDPMQPIPADKEVRTGRLDNGLTYYIRHNEKPKGQADFYILHNVGAIQEEDDQQGLAHFLEHMAFNGTKNLPGKQLIEYLETVGVKFGYNLNAGTSWDQTVYNISDVPTSRQGIIDSAMLILHDWSHFIALRPEEIDSERGVIMEELRTRDGASWRSTMKLLQALGKGTRYEHRNLIGYLDGLKSFEHDALERFYKKWYRPDYQAIVIVGDLDAEATEARLKSLMADIPAPAADAAQKEVIVVPDNEEPIVSIYTDPEMQGSRVQLFIKRPAMPTQMNDKVAWEVVNVIESFLTTMENARLQEIAMQPDAPFLGAGMGSGDVIGIIPTLNATAFTAMTQDGKLAEGFEALYTEMEKIRRHGFTQSEFERAQENLMRQVERTYANRNDRTNEQFVNIYLENYRKNEPMPDAETEWKLDSMLIKMLNVETVNAFAKETIQPTNQVIVITAPEKEGIENPTEEEILAIREKVTASEIEAYEDDVVKEPLIPEGTQLKGSPVKKTVENKEYGATVWTLANGTQIVVKPTKFKADEVRMNAQSKGGLSILPDAEYYMGEMMPAVSSMSGVGKFSATELRKQLSGKSATVQPSVGEYASAVNASCSPKDIETMLQLVYLNFTQPRFDRNDYDNLMKMLRTQLENAKSNPDFQMQEKVIDVLYGHNPRRQVISTELLDEFSFEALPAIYKKLYPDGNSFRFTFVGNIDPETLKPLVEKYIGSIPASKKPMTFADDKAYPVKGEVTEDFSTPMQQPKVSVNYTFTGDMDYSLENKAALSFLTQALNSRYLVSIREEKGGTYGVQVYGSTDWIPRETYTMTIAFDTNAEMADELCEIILKELRTIAEEGPLTEDIEKHREFMLKNWKNSLDENGPWMQYLQAKYGSGLDYLAGQEQAIRSLTNADVQALAKKILDDGNMVKVVMRPEANEDK